MLAASIHQEAEMGKDDWVLRTVMAVTKTCKTLIYQGAPLGPVVTC